MREREKKITKIIIENPFKCHESWKQFIVANGFKIQIQIRRRHLCVLSLTLILGVVLFLFVAAQIN